MGGKVTSPPTICPDDRRAGREMIIAIVLENLPRRCHTISKHLATADLLENGDKLLGKAVRIRVTNHFRDVAVRLPIPSQRIHISREKTKPAKTAFRLSPHTHTWNPGDMAEPQRLQRGKVES